MSSIVQREESISIIVAYNNKRTIGLDNKIPWHISDDLKKFKKITLGSVIIMGRKTHESIGKTLSKRVNIIISRNLNYLPCDFNNPFIIADSFMSALQVSHEHWIENPKELKETFVIGGGQIYKKALLCATKIYATEINNDIEGDVFFPEISEEWQRKDVEQYNNFSFVVYERDRNKNDYHKHIR